MVLETGSSYEQALHFMRNGEYYGGRLFPQRDQVYALVKSLDGLEPVTHIPSNVVGFAFGLSVIYNQPIALINHGQNRTVEEKSAILMAHHDDITDQLGMREVSVLPLKTITLRFVHEGASSYVLLSRVGDYPLDPDTKSDLKPALNRLFKTERNFFKRGFAINLTEIDTKQMFGIEPGLVSPFVRANLTGLTRGLLYYQDDSLDGFVAIAITLNDTFVVHQTVFHSTLLWWQGDFLGVPFSSVLKTPITQAL